MKGTIPEEYGNIEFLMSLDINDCYFTGTLPEQVASISWLGGIDLFNNYFDGSIPGVLFDGE
jgi:hypothetical protein